ncbi:MAG: group III truncated hemoglobin [Flavobacteriales bacterium]|nr:MAG: group III truncated hemoglobin [Flavobacteriales bacterium]
MSPLTDITTKEQVDELVVRFYDRLLADEGIADHFRHLDLHEHLPRIAAFWNMVLFGDLDYRGDMMGTHKRHHQQRPMTDEHFRIWLGHFNAALDERYAGPNAEMMKERAVLVAASLKVKVGS